MSFSAKGLIPKSALESFRVAKVRVVVEVALGVKKFRVRPPPGSRDLECQLIAQLITTLSLGLYHLDSGYLSEKNRELKGGS